jgi:hypothetical protein
MLSKSAGILLIAAMLFASDASLAAPSSATTACFKDGQAVLLAAQARAARRRRPRHRRLRPRQTAPQATISPATQTTTPVNKHQPPLRVINPAEDAMPPVRPTPTPDMKNP